jgi:hypothetical protein
VKERSGRFIVMSGTKRKMKITSATIAIVVLLVLLATSRDSSAADATTATTSDIWHKLLQRTPCPYTLPLPPPNATSIDGTYTKFEIKEIPPVHCRRCPDYAPEGGIWKLNLSKGVFRIFHRVTGWKDIGSFILSGDQLILANDPVCHELVGVYQWKLEEGKPLLNLVEDNCAVGLRAMNLTKLPWLSCQPSKREAAITDHWPKPAGCDE